MAACARRCPLSTPSSTRAPASSSCSHLGRPDGAPDPKYSLEPVAQRLSELLGKPVAFARDTVGESAHDAVAALEDGDVAVIENLRFNPGETVEGRRRARVRSPQQLAELGDVLVSDGFGVVHRKQASVYDLAEILPSAAGLLIADRARRARPPHREPASAPTRSSSADRRSATSSASSRTCCRAWTGSWSAAACCSPSSRRRVTRSARACSRQDQLDTRARLHRRRRRSAGWSSCSRPTSWSPHVLGATRSTWSRPPTRSRTRRSVPPASDSTSGPTTAARFAEVIRGSTTVFWNGPMGVFELAGVRGGHQGRRAGAHRGRRPQRRRRRRLGRGRASARLRRRPVRPHLDGRRRQPRVPRGQEAPRTGGPRMAVTR